MNHSFAQILVYTFFIAIGLFNLAKGLASLRSRTESKIFARLRLVLGSLLLIVPPLLFFFLGVGRSP
ncbi:MAG TPA: hypothetical protein VI895_09235 [Bdellovibrionota bacterium]|nr:hypothetical protein [Bdellovibrionota bacterium]